MAVQDSAQPVVSRRRRTIPSARRTLRAPGVLPLAAIVVVILVWQAVVSGLAVPAYLVPTPAAVWSAGIDNLGLLLHNGGVTLVETLVGFGLSAVVAVPLAVAMTSWPIIGRALYPILVSSQVIPKVAIAPLVVVWIGTGTLTSALIAFVMGFFPVVVNTVLGLESVDPASLHLIRSMGGGRRHEFRYLRLPGALPHLWTGLKLAMAFSVVGAIVGEFVGSQAGLGYLLIVSQGNLNTSLLFADLVVLTLGGLLLYGAVDVIGRRAIRWA